MERSKILKKLQKDSEYYGKFGKQFLSASNIRQLLYKPTDFNKSEKTLPLLQGRYFHTKILEPEKIDTIPVFNASSRTTNAFKQYKIEQQLDQYDVLLTKEKVRNLSVGLIWTFLLLMRMVVCVDIMWAEMNCPSP